MSKNLDPRNLDARFIDALSAFEKALQNLFDTHTTKNFPSLTSDVVSSQWGPKYVKILRTTRGLGHSSQSVYCFIDKATGDILKPASWAAPVKKNPRASIYDADSGMSNCGPYGVAYMNNLRPRKES